MLHPENSLLGPVREVVVPRAHVHTRAGLLELQHVTKVGGGGVVELLVHVVLSGVVYVAALRALTVAGISCQRRGLIWLRRGKLGHEGSEHGWLIRVGKQTLKADTKSRH